MKVYVQRYHPDTGERWIQMYEVDCSKRSMTVQDVLEEIAQGTDPSLGFFRHSSCNHGICGRCSVDVNGYTKLACIERVEGYTELHLSPAAKRIVVRDLVTRFDR